MWRTLSSMALEMTWKKIRCNPSQWNVLLSWIQRPKSCAGSSHELHSSLQPEITLLWQSRANKKQCLLDMTSAEFENYKSELIWYCIRACLCSLGYTDRTIWNSFCAADCQLNASEWHLYVGYRGLINRFLWIVAGLIEASLNKVIVESRIFLSSSVIQWWEPTNTWFGSFKNKPKQECGKCSVIKKAKLFGMIIFLI